MVGINLRKEMKDLNAENYKTLAIYVYVSLLLSLFVPLTPSPAVSASLFMSASPLLPCK